MVRDNTPRQEQTAPELIRWAETQFTEAGLFFGHGTETALDEAAALVLFSMGLQYDTPLDEGAPVMTAEQRGTAVRLIQRRIEERVPAAYLTGESVFAGHRFYVDHRVLVPRSPFAELIQERFAPWIDPSGTRRILDLCTGSGCIAIACALEMEQVQVDAVDLSPEALEVAAVNVARHRLENRVRLIRSDLLRELGQQRYDLIVSNPPYVSQSEWYNLPPEYHAEPRFGFDGGESGLDCVERILRDARPYLEDHGVLIVEVGSSAEVLQSRYPEVRFLWLDFELGGDGVFLLTAEQLDSFPLRPYR